MIFKLKMIIILALGPIALFAQCPSFSVTLNSQTEVDNFIVNFPNCTILEPFLRIEGADIVNLDGLSNLTHLNGGILLLDNPSLTSLSGLHNVEYIGGVSMLGNDLITDLSGLSSLIHIEGQLQIESNTSLENFSGLELLDTIGNQLFIYNNPNLSDISALGNLNFIGGNLIISICPFLSFCSIDAICEYIAEPNGVILLSANGIGCNTQQEIQDECEACPVDNVWQGPIAGSWHTIGNWSLNEIPSDCHNVIIPAGSNLKVLTGKTALAFTLTIENTAIVETETSAVLEIIAE